MNRMIVAFGEEKVSGTCQEQMCQEPLSGPRSSDTATITSTLVDASVQRLDTAYDTQGNPYRFTSYADAGAMTLVNQVQRSFNGLGQLTAETQIHPAGQQATVQYTYSNMLDGQRHYADHR